MPMHDTKSKILDAALQLFNQEGVSNVTMRDIARLVGISAGNLAYHFKNKDFIIEALFHAMESEREKMLTEVQLIPSFENINRQVVQILSLTEKYQFFFLDALQLIRLYPKLADLQRKYIDTHVRYIKAMLDYSVGSGNLQAEEEPDRYYRLAHTVWMNIFFWIMQARIRNTNDGIFEARQAMWDLVKPYLTEKGKENFKAITNDESRIIQRHE
jgi:AcrR family transcriptional regulator